jgi:hypothetical protein
MTIRTWYEHPPIPLRDFDYGAVCDGYEGGDPIGWAALRLRQSRTWKHS